MLSILIVITGFPSIAIATCHENAKDEVSYNVILGFSGCSHQLSIPKPETVKYLSIDYAVSEKYKTSVYYEKLINVQITDNPRENILNIAKSQLGYIEGNNKNHLDGTYPGKHNYTEYGHWYGMQDQWCAMFVSWCANWAGDTNIPKHASCAAGLKQLIKENKVHSRQDIINGEYTPQPGDIIYFVSKSVSSNDGLTNHVGIVTNYDNGIIYTIEGNTSTNDKSISCGGCVEEKSYKITNTYIAYIAELT